VLPVDVELLRGSLAADDADRLMREAAHFAVLVVMVAHKCVSAHLQALGLGLEMGIMLALEPLLGGRHGSSDPRSESQEARRERVVGFLLGMGAPLSRRRVPERPIHVRIGPESDSGGVLQLQRGALRLHVEVRDTRQTKGRQETVETAARAARAPSRGRGGSNKTGAVRLWSCPSPKAAVAADRSEGEPRDCPAGPAAVTGATDVDRYGDKYIVAGETSSSSDNRGAITGEHPSFSDSVESISSVGGEGATAIEEREINPTILQSAQFGPIRTEHKHTGDENRSEKYGLTGW